MTKQEINEKIEENVKFLIDNSSLTKRELETAIELPKGTFSNFFRTHSIQASLLVMIADYFAVPLDFITGRCTEDQAEYIMDNYLFCYTELCRTSYEKYLLGKKYDNISIDYVRAQFPYNLLEDIVQGVWEYPMSKEQEAGLIKSLKKLSAREILFLTSYYRDNKTFKEIAKDNELSDTAAKRVIEQSIRKLQTPECLIDIKYGHDRDLLRFKNELENRKANLNRFNSKLEEYENRLKQKEKDLMQQECELRNYESNLMPINQRLHYREIDLYQILRNLSAPINPETLKISDIKFSKVTYNFIKNYRHWFRYDYAFNEAYCDTLQDLIDLVTKGRLKCISGLRIESAREILEVIYILTGVKYNYDGVDVTQSCKDDKWYGSWR